MAKKRRECANVLPVVSAIPFDGVARGTVWAGCRPTLLRQHIGRSSDTFLIGLSAVLPAAAGEKDSGGLGRVSSGKVICRAAGYGPDGRVEATRGGRGRIRRRGRRVPAGFRSFAVDAFPVVLLGLPAQVAARAHSKAVGEQVGHPEDDDHAQAQLRAAPLAPLTTAKVVMMPSLAPNTRSPMWCAHEGQKPNDSCDSCGSCGAGCAVMVTLLPRN